MGKMNGLSFDRMFHKGLFEVETSEQKPKCISKESSYAKNLAENQAEVDNAKALR